MNSWRALVRHCLTAFATLALLALLTSCASDGALRPVGEGPGVPQFIELQEAPTINTFHFPRGTYTLEAEDDSGYYYRAPVRLTQRSFAGGMPHDGGVFVARGKRQQLRGYVVWAAGRTKIGNLSRARYQFRG